MKPVLYALCTAATIAGYSTLSGIGVRTASSFLAYAGYIEVLTGVGVTGFILVREKGRVRKAVKEDLNKNAGAGIISVAGYASALWAMTKVPIATVAALRETSIIFAAVFGIVLFKEEHGRVRIASAIIVAVGVGLLSFK